MGKLPHVVVVPAPAQSHVMSLMRLSHKLADHGIKVTFVNTDFMHSKLMAPMSNKDSQIHLVSVPDGLEPGDDRRDVQKLNESILRVMPYHLENLIRKIKESNEDEELTCIITDVTFWWPLQIAEKMGIRGAAFWPAAAGTLALSLHIPKLIEAGIIDNNGSMANNEMIQLSPTIPGISTSELIWNCTADKNMQNAIFEAALNANKAIKVCNWLLCNSALELEPWACELIPNIQPIAPLISSNWQRQPASHFLHADSSCLNWLDQQPLRSVIYVAFGSISFLNQCQFNELALGLEYVARPFILVVRPDFTDELVTKYPDGFIDRIAKYGKIVSWAPQQEVLAHPSIACFFTHCGWNSTLDAITMGVPFLCWPNKFDQFLQKNYICDVWKVGLEINPDHNGIVSRDEIKTKLDRLLLDKDIIANSSQLMEVAKKTINEGGTSFNNIAQFVQQLKQ
ncbi:UDP-glycosyltransferase 83A1 [Macadamia integrifolia]|uniref:UDP-glycosyltransferase 83A1 n=1 Tax=Macadamia integrifolia TaxID=60698 RepID=UPI001C4E36F0|nr:UDP-glycosyltransferase 83A1 [Macadamia integrifolia]